MDALEAAAVSRNGMTSAAAKTPGSAIGRMFGAATAATGEKPGFSLTQAFNHTQGDITPSGFGFKSDPVFERPSPDERLATPAKYFRSSPPKSTVRKMVEDDEVKVEQPRLLSWDNLEILWVQRRVRERRMHDSRQIMLQVLQSVVRKLRICGRRACLVDTF